MRCIRNSEGLRKSTENAYGIVLWFQLRSYIPANCWHTANPASPDTSYGLLLQVWQGKWQEWANSRPNLQGKSAMTIQNASLAIFNATIRCSPLVFGWAQETWFESDSALGGRAIKKRVEISLQPFSDRGHPSPFNWTSQFDANIRIIFLPPNFSSASASSSPMKHIFTMS